VNGSCKEMPICEDQLDTWDKVNNESGNGVNGELVIKTCPEVIQKLSPSVIYAILSLTLLFFLLLGLLVVSFVHGLWFCNCNYKNTFVKGN